MPDGTDSLEKVITQGESSDPHPNAFREAGIGVQPGRGEARDRDLNKPKIGALVRHGAYLRFPAGAMRERDKSLDSPDDYDRPGFPAWTIVDLLKEGDTWHGIAFSAYAFDRINDVSSRCNDSVRMNHESATDDPWDRGYSILWDRHIGDDRHDTRSNQGIGGG